MTLRHRCSACGALALVLVACGSKGEDKSGEKAAGATVAETCKLENDGKDVTLVAHLTTPTIVGACNERCTVELTDTGEYSTVSIRAQIPAGTGQFTMKPLPANTTGGVTTVAADAFTVTDSDGSARPVGSRVRIAGKLKAETLKIDLGDGTTKEALSCELIATSVHAAQK